MDSIINELKKLSKKVSYCVVGTEGNVSASYDGGIIIKGSGKSLHNVQSEDFVLVKNDTYDGNIKPSMEYKFHDWIIKNLNVKFVSHTHPTNTLKILCSSKLDEFATCRMFPDQVVFNGSKSCVIDYYHPGDDLYEHVKKGITDFISENDFVPKLVLLKNHGIITFGDTVGDCVVRTEMCEKSAEIFLGSINNGINTLSNYDIDKLVNDKREKYRQNILKK